MGFLGPVTVLDGSLVRPHDIEVVTVPFPGAYAGRIARSSRVGFEVRLEVALTEAGRDGATQSAPVLVTLTRAEAAAKQLDEGLPVWVKPIAEAASCAV